MEAVGAEVLLRQYTECADRGQSEALLEALVVEYALPGIRKIVRHKLAFQGAAESQDVEDVASDVVVELIGRLRAMKEGSAAAAIADFSGYAAVSAYHACNEYLRRKYPNRHRLKTQLRYLLNTEKRFAIWEAGGQWICGLARWQNAALTTVPIETLNQWREKLGDIPHGRSRLQPADLLSKIFDRFAAPVEFDELVGIVSQFWGVDDAPAAAESAANELDSGEANPAEKLELRQWMTAIWREIGDLPQPQRAALLLNLRCGTVGSAAALIPLTGVASVREVASILGFAPEQFAAIWNQLPLDDLAIAELLGVARQKVINLRKSARERLIRRMGGKYA